MKTDTLRLDGLALARLVLEGAQEAAIMLQDSEPELANWMIDVEAAARAIVAKADHA